MQSTHYKSHKSLNRASSSPNMTFYIILHHEHDLLHYSTSEVPKVSGKTTPNGPYEFPVTQSLDQSTFKNSII